MAESKELSKIKESIDEVFQLENAELLDKKRMLTSHLGEFREEIEAIDLVLNRRLTIISFSKALKVLDNDELELLLCVAKSNTKSELYRKGFKNSDPYDIDSWNTINLLESMNLIKIHRHETTRSVYMIENLVPKDLLDDTFKK
jgi:hypothetical protein